MLHRFHFLEVIEGVRTAEHQRGNEAIHFVVAKGAELFLCWLEQIAIIVRVHSSMESRKLCSSLSISSLVKKSKFLITNRERTAGYLKRKPRFFAPKVQIAKGTTSNQVISCQTLQTSSPQARMPLPLRILEDSLSRKCRHRIRTSRVQPSIPVTDWVACLGNARYLTPVLPAGQQAHQIFLKT